jgi:glycerol-3-phosphate acyltransferase PlsY
VGLFLVVTAATRFVSLGSMLASIAFPVLVLATGGSGGVAAVSLAIAVLIVLRHRGNIVRLLAGTERKLGRSAS